jgi:hypothetical protein
MPDQADDPRMDPRNIADPKDIPGPVMHMTFRPYNIHDWYWLADDGRVFSSARRVTVDENDAGYKTFLEGGAATRWPQDLAGEQTDAALQDVFERANFDPPITISVKSNYKQSQSTNQKSVQPHPSKK